jgi:hypothetical protein
VGIQLCLDTTRSLIGTCDMMHMTNTKQIENFGNQPIAGERAPTGQATRLMEVHMRIPPAFARLITTTDNDAVVTNQGVPLVRPRDTVSMQQQFRVLNTAEDHKHFFVNFDLYMEAAQQPQINSVELVLVERQVVRLQVSSTYMRTPNARFLLVTNPKTTERQSRVIQEFIQTSLHMGVDVCNVHQNGGLLCSADPLSESSLEEPQPILQAYHDKAVIFLDDSFDFFGCEAKTASQLCDPMWLQQMNVSNSSGLFIGTPKNSSIKARISHATLSDINRLGNTLDNIESVRIFSSQEKFVQTIVEERQLGKLTTGISAIIPRERKWYHGSRPRQKKEAQALARYLRDHLPNERFMVSYDGSEHLIVNTGTPQHTILRSIESKIILRPASDTDPTLTRLDRYIKYMIVATIPFHQRIDILWREIEHNDPVVHAIQLSALHDLSDQFHGLQTSNYRKLLRMPKDDTKSLNSIAKTHIPLVIDLLCHPNAASSTLPPMPIIHILQWLLALASTFKRHSHLENILISLLRNKPSTTSLLNTPDFLAGVSTNNPDELLEQICELAATTSHVLIDGQTSARQVVPSTEYYSPGRWDSMVGEIEVDRERLARDMEGAKRELERMLVENEGREEGAIELMA